MPNTAPFSVLTHKCVIITLPDLCTEEMQSLLFRFFLLMFREYGENDAKNVRDFLCCWF